MFRARMAHELNRCIHTLFQHRVVDTSPHATNRAMTFLDGDQLMKAGHMRIITALQFGHVRALECNCIHSPSRYPGFHLTALRLTQSAAPCGRVGKKILSVPQELEALDR